MSKWLILAGLIAVSPGLALAGPPPAKRPVCQIPKAPAREAKRPEPCRRQAIPPVIDPTPMFLASTGAAPAVQSDLS